jgi:uncharacterized protein involved in exopolysaccharide biosynthesis
VKSRAASTVAEGQAPRESSPSPAPAPVDHGSADLFDWPAIRRRAIFVWGAPRRHPRLAGATFGACLLLAMMAAVFLPRTYRTEARIMATRNLVMPALNNPGRAIPMDADAPTRGAAVTIMRRESLIALVKQTNLVVRWKESRPALFRLKDKVASLFSGPPDQEAQIDALVYLLEQRLKVTTDDGIITIQVDWQDASTAHLLVSTAQQDFMETRHAIEVSTIAEAISILEGHAAEVQARVQADSQSLRATRDSQGGGQGQMASGAASKRPVVKESTEVTNLRLLLAGKRRAIADLETFRQRRLGELQAQLAELKSTYTSAHPLIQATRETMESLTRDSPQLAQLRREEQELVAQVAILAGDVSGEDRSAAVAAAVAATPSPVLLRELRTRQARPGDSDDAETMRLRVNYAVQKYEAIVDRVESARIELDTARAAFKYRYSVVRPAEVPKTPVKPNIPLTLFSGLLLGALLAFGSTAWLDWRLALLGTSVQPVVQGVGTSVQPVVQGVGTSVQSVVQGVGTSVQSVVQGVGTSVQPMVQGDTATGGAEPPLAPSPS